jgi:cell division septation protein DedD
MNTNKYEYLENIKVKINETDYDIFLKKVFNSLNTKLNKDSVDDKVDYSVDVKVFYKSENLDKNFKFKIEYETSSSGIATVEYIYANKNTTDGNIDRYDYNNYTYEFYEIDIVNNNNIKKMNKKLSDYVIELPINLLYVYLIDVLKKYIKGGKFNIKDIEEITTKSVKYEPPEQPKMPVEVAWEKYLHKIDDNGKTFKDDVSEQYDVEIEKWSEKLNEYQENYIREHGIHKFAIMCNKYESEKNISSLLSLTEEAKATKAAEEAKAAKAAKAAEEAKAAKAAEEAQQQPRSLKDLYGKKGGIGGKNIKVKNNEPKYKDILGKKMKIYKKPDSRKEYVKYKKELISILDYKKLAKLKAKSLVAKTKTTSKPNAKTTSKPKAKPATKPKAKPATKPKAKPTTKPATKLTTKTTTKSKAKQIM